MKINYKEYNYCKGCQLQFTKNVLRCLICHQKVRTAPRKKKPYIPTHGKKGKNLSTLIRLAPLEIRMIA